MEGKEKGGSEQSLLPPAGSLLLQGNIRAEGCSARPAQECAWNFPTNGLVAWAPNGLRSLRHHHGRHKQQRCCGNGPKMPHFYPTPVLILMLHFLFILLLQFLPFLLLLPLLLFLVFLPLLARDSEEDAEAKEEN